MTTTLESGTPSHDCAAPTMLDGAPRDLLCLAAAGLDLAGQRGRPLEMAVALASMARAHRLLKSHVAAEDMRRQALRWARGSGSNDLQVEVLCELGEDACCVAEDCAEADPNAAHAARERARDVAFELSTLVRQVSDPMWEAKALLRASDILNRCGDHEDAAQLQGRALQLMVGAPSGGL